MPAGDLLNHNGQIELRGVLMGYGTDYRIDEPGLTFIKTAKVRQVSFDAANGDYAATDLLGVLVIPVPLIILGDSPDDAMDLFDALDAAWTVGDDVVLHGRMAGWDHWSVTGRSRPTDGPDLSELDQNTITVDYEFHALTPTITKNI